MVRRVARWIAVSTTLSVPLVAAAMWWSRDDWLAHGPPCTEGGPYDCARDPGLAAGYGLVVGGAFAVAVGAAWLVSRRLPRLGTTLAAGVAAGWVVVATVLLQGTRR